MGGLSLHVNKRTSVPADGYLNISDNSGEEEGRMKRQTSPELSEIFKYPSAWGDRLLSPVMAWCLVHWTLSH